MIWLPTLIVLHAALPGSGKKSGASGVRRAREAGEGRRGESMGAGSGRGAGEERTSGRGAGDSRW
jgi:hypothetical protein